MLNNSYSLVKSLVLKPVYFNRDDYFIWSALFVLEFSSYLLQLKWRSAYE